MRRRRDFADRDPNHDANACKTFADDLANAGCAKCIFTESSAAKLGPVVELPGPIILLNVEGCIADLTGDTTVNGCGAKVRALRQCDEAACDHAFPTCPDASGDQVMVDCFRRADVSVCASFARDEACSEDLAVGGGVSQPCASSGDQVTDAIRLATLFCAPMPGTDGGADASTD